MLHSEATETLSGSAGAAGEPVQTARLKAGLLGLELIRSAAPLLDASMPATVVVPTVALN